MTTTNASTPLNLPAPGDPADYYATHWHRSSEAQLLFEHGGPETRKGGAHAPVLVRHPNPNRGIGEMATATGCMCGHRPRNWPKSPRSTEAAYRAHVRSLGLPPVRNFHHAVYAYGEGYQAEGLTWAEWYAATGTGGPSPFGPRR